MKICIFGAGAIGGFVAARLAQVSGLDVSVVARGEQLLAIRTKGLRITTPQGDTHAVVNATDTPAELGVQDVVFIALKQHQLSAALPGITALLGSHTTVVPPTTGIPYWYFHGLPGPHSGRQIEALDAGAQQWRQLTPQRALGCVYWVATEVVEPGVIRHDGLLMKFPIGEPGGFTTPRLQALADAMNAAGLNAPIVADIRGWIWAKMISSLSWNPVAVLTGATLAELNATPPVVAVVRRMMGEADAVAARLGVAQSPIPIDQRIAAARQAGQHKMSMLQDWERGRPLETDVLLDSIGAMRELAGLATPAIDEVYALLKLRVAARPAPIC